MASIRQQNSSPYWYACITLSDGRQTQRSTKSKDRKKALKIAEVWEEAENEKREGILTEQAARKHISKSYEIVAGRKISFYSIGEWIDEWLKLKSDSRREGTIIRYGPASRSFVSSLGDRAKLDIRHTDVSDARKFRKSLIKSGKANASINMDCRALSGAFNSAVKQGLLDKNPFSALESLDEEKSSRKPFSDEQVTRIFSNIEGEMEGLCKVAFYTGMRLSDIVNLKWANLYLNEKVPFVRFKEIKKQDKHKQEITVPIHAVLLEYLFSLPKKKEGDLLFPELAKKRSGGYNGLSQSFRRVLLNIGLVENLYQRQQKGTVKRKVSQYSFHSFRHTFKSNLANKGVASEVYDVLTGHRKPSVAEGYVHRNIECLSDAIALLPRLVA